MRVFTGGLATETNTFAPMPTGLASFRDRGYYAAGTHPEELSFFAGPLHAARQRGRAKGWTVIEGMVAAAQPSGTTTRVAYETLRDELLGDLRAALPVDMVVFGLHGAMVADGYDDCEGDLLARVRALVGPKTVVGAELDPHNHLTPAMLANADLLISFKEYPHTDILERAHELVDLCAAQVEGKVKLVGAAVDCEMLVTMHTSRDPARSFVDRIQALEGKDGILSISVSHGFAWGDTEHMGTQVLVYADGEAAKAQALARRLADELIGLREQLGVRYPSINEALDEALAFDGGPVVLADGADNPGGGASGDSTFVLRRMLERGIANACLGPLWDPVAVRIAFDAGVGAVLPHGTLTPDTLIASLRAVVAGTVAMPADMLSRLLLYVTQTSHLGPTGLNTRERSVLRLLADGMDTRGIAEDLCFSERTVKNVVHDVLTKLNCRTRAQAVAVATREGVI